MITTNNATQSDYTAGQSAAKSTESSAASESDFQSFLMLLTAQLRNQDPLSPLDSTQFVEQLASFSSVEQQIETNSLLETLTSQLAVSDLDGVTQWIGQEIEVESGAARFKGEALDYRLPDTVYGSSAEFVVTDISGDTIYKQSLAAGEYSFSWAGETTSGETAPEGDYYVTINMIDDGETIGSAIPVAQTTVREARIIDSAVKLVLGNGDLAEADDIIAVRSPQEDNEEA